MTKLTNPYAHAYADVLSETAEHQLVVLHDDGLYRHLRIQKPGTRMWSWNITTWPGHLATSGDIADGYMFTRELDMIQFFARNDSQQSYYSDGAPSIDVHYWAEKLCGGRSYEVKRYDADVFLQLVREPLEQHEELGSEVQEFREKKLALLKTLHAMRSLDETASQTLLEAHWRARATLTNAESRSGYTSGRLVQLDREAAHTASQTLWSTDGLSDEQHNRLMQGHDWYELGDTDINQQPPAERRQEVLDDAKWHADSESEAHKWLQDQSEIFGADTWEWDLRDYDIHFLFTCYCIDLAVRIYHEYQAQQPSLPESTRLSSRVFGFLVRGFRALGRPRRRSSHPTAEAVQS
ncbi:hypothetical protein AB0E06_38285 [Streptomyces sp. NPDC048109]|uniref:hypothetical protein n=1 Tax=Streptomyces sp. NPDC048109 TaxID=3155482 RepID=UPI00341ABFD7